ncbi:MAG: hypothetical protein DMG57_15115 [Acidobacteria bacterium]|nr:MAG: hypothetical protein DMG57_15115 [Acidobacteriota bacterium]
MGTPYYMAPEQVLGKAITEQVDVYAFGVMLFELMTGAKPITGDTVERIFYCILQEPLDLAPLRQAGVHDPVIDLVVRCTEKDPSRRPQGFSEVCARIQKIMNEWDASTRASKAPATIDPAMASTVAVPRAVSVQPAPAREEAAPVPAPAPSKPWLIPAVVIGLAIAGGGIYFALRSPAVVPAPAEISNAPKIPERLALLSGDMMVVPAGLFLFGKDKQSQSLPPFYIDKTEVSVGAYAQFCEAKGRPLPKANSLDHSDYPVVDVTFDDAREFAKWAGKRLPSTQEWEKAARGTDGRLYPWGNNPDPARANVGHANGSVTVVAGFENGASPGGALNMLGNVWEWVDELRTPSALALAHFAKILDPAPTAEEPWYVIRGGSFHDQPSDAYLWDAATIPARHHDKNIGFRCAKNP